MRPVARAILLVITLSGIVRAFDFITARGNGLGQTIVLSDPTVSASLSVPGAHAADQQAGLELGISRQYELKEFDRVYFAAAFRKGVFTGAAGFTQFGHGDLYSERTSRVAAAFHHHWLSLGAVFSLLQVDFADEYPTLSGHSVGLALSCRAGPILAAFVADDLNSPRLDAGSSIVDAKYTVYTELIGPGPYSVTGRLTAQRFEKPQFGVGQIVRVSDLGSLMWGLATAPLTYGAGLELMHKRSLITYATSYHPTLGFSHTFSISYTIGKSGSDGDGKSYKRGH